MERLAALEAEVKADADAQRARKEAAQAKVREQRAAQEAERAELRARQTALVGKKQRPVSSREDEDDRGSDLGSALELATKASRVKQELTKAPKQGDKSWVKSGVASMLLGPLGWLYAGSLREAVPASAAWLAFAALASKVIPVFLLFPVLLVALPLSGIAGLLYAVQYNKTGSRQRLFGDKGKKKQLKSG